MTQSTQPPSPIEKASTGIDGFDDITAGGIPRGRTTLVVGGPGTGKTTFGLQTLVNGARQFGEPGIFIAFEERSRQIVANASTFGWDLPALMDDNLFFIDARPTTDVITAGQFDLTALLAGLEAKVQQMGARRIVFDSVDVLLSMLDDPLVERREMYRIHDWLSSSGEIIQKELEARRAELAALQLEEKSHEQGWRQRRAGLQDRRADAGAEPTGVPGATEGDS